MNSDQGRSRFRAADARDPASVWPFARLACALLPGALAAAGASSTAAAVHDDGVVRTIGAGFTGVFRSLDVLVAAPWLLVPMGTRALRAGLASAFVTALAGAILFDLARELVTTAVPAALERMKLRSKRPVSPRLAAAVAAVAVLAALLSPAWQAEACAPGGAVTGALLVILAVRLGSRPLPAAGDGGGLPAAQLALVLGSALAHEPLVFGAALAASAPGLALAARGARAGAFDRARAAQVACAFALGLAPLLLGIGLCRRDPEISLHVPTATPIERAMHPISIRAFATVEIGTALLVVCAAGAALSLAFARARPLALGLAFASGAGAVAVALQVPAGPSRYAAPVLAGLACAWVLGATTLAVIVLAVARARVPFAEASAALLVVLELVLPVKAIDETLTRRDARAAHAASIWNDVAWGSAPPASVLLVADRGTMRRLASARAAGAMRGDIVVVPSFDVQGRAGQRALLAEPKLAPLYRDIALGVAPEELSLAQLSAQRPVLATFDPKWDRTLARHLVPIGLTARFEPEPRGASDRKKALDAFTASKERLVRVTVVKKDAELAAATAALLRARAIGIAATGELEVLSRALDDLRAFAPNDPVGSTLVRRILTSRGPIDVRDLAP